MSKLMVYGMFDGFDYFSFFDFFVGAGALDVLLLRLRTMIRILMQMFELPEVS